MNEIIKISSEFIGIEKVNSVNARELHQVLEIGKDFTTWMNTQINSLGLEKNVDYIVYEVKGNGRPQKEYIITTDTAKHISMASRTTKGKEVRNYFIQIEKEYFSPNIQKLSGRVGGLTKANNDLRKELDKWKKKSKARFENLEDDVDELKSKQFLLTQFDSDKKIDILLKQNKDLFQSIEYPNTFTEIIQKNNRFWTAYIEALRTDGTELQRWAINGIENEKKRRVEAEKELYKMKYRYEKTLNKISDLQKIAKNIVDFDMEIEKEMNKVDFS